MKISLIIPAFNEENNIAEAIVAALAQNHPDFEVIVVDNASTDRTAEIAGTFPVKVVRENKKGTSAARECGRRTASGEILAYADADCLPDPDWLSTGAEIFKDSGVVAASGPYDYYDGGKVFRRFSLFTQKFIYKQVNTALQSSHTGGTMTGGNSFFRASALEKIGGFNTDIAFYGDDTDIARRLAKVGRIEYSNRLIMKTSARRFKAEGAVNIFGKYIFHFVKQICK